MVTNLKQDIEKIEEILEQYQTEINLDFLKEIFSKEQYDQYFDFIFESATSLSILRFLTVEQIVNEDLALHSQEIELFKKAENLTPKTEGIIDFYEKIINGLIKRNRINEAYIKFQKERELEEYAKGTFVFSHT